MHAMVVLFSTCLGGFVLFARTGLCRGIYDLPRGEAHQRRSKVISTLGIVGHQASSACLGRTGRFKAGRGRR